MHTGTGEIVDLPFVDELRKTKPKIANFYKKIPDGYLSLLQSMNRKQRRDWYRKNKHLFKEGKE
jgi:hypothetical protein